MSHGSDIGTGLAPFQYVRAATKKGLGIAAAVVVALAVVAVVATRLWLGSEHGKRTVEHKIDAAVARHVASGRGGGHVHIGKLAGSLVGGATLDDVEWRDASGAVALRAEHVSARWSAAKAIAKRPAIELRVERPFVDVERLAADFDVEELARAVAHDAERVDAISVPRFEMVDATVRVGALTMSGVDASGALAWDRAAGRVALDGVAVRAGASSATLRGNLSRDAVDVRVTALRIAADDLRRLSPRAEAPRTPLVGELRLHGRSDGAMLLGELRPDHGRILVAGNIDLRGRRAQLRAALDDAEADYTPAVLAGTVRVHAAIDDGALRLTWRAAGHYFRRELDPNVQSPMARERAFAAVRPGGRFAGDGRLDARVVDGAPAARMRFVLTVDDPARRPASSPAPICAPPRARS